RRHPQRASSRRRGADAISGLGRPRGAVGRTDRDRRRRSAGDVPPPDRRAEGCLLPHDFRHRPERRHRALPRHPQEQPAHRARRSPADRFRRAVPGRHHRRHPHHRGRRADRRDARPLYPRAARPHRDCARGVSRRHHRRAAGFLCAPVLVAGRARFRARHRPR
ncbi:hypothetical protein KXW38_001543, partial [Aspergillus fumigatus]